MKKNNIKTIQQKLRANDKETLGLVYTTYRSEFLSFAKKYYSNQTDILDIYQESILALQHNFVEKQLELKQDVSIKTYLFAIGKYKIQSQFKQKNQHVELKEELRDWEINRDELSIEQKLLSKHFGRLTDVCQTILRLFYYRNLSIKEIVEHTSYKDENTVKSQKSRCLRKLKSLIKSKENV